MYARMTKGDDGKMLIEIIDSCLLPTISADQDLREIYLQANKALGDKGFIRSGPWHYLEGEGHRAPLFDRELTSPEPPADPSEADVMLASSQTLALRALKVLDKARANAEAWGKDPNKNHDCMKARAALDAHCDQLAQLMFVRKHQAAGGSAISEYPSGAATEQYLRVLAAETAKFAETHLAKKEA